MAKTFDPYHKWLAIPPRDQPPNHYRLLGIDLFEPDPDVISNAADMRMTLVRSFQSGKHSEESQKLLNEISAARVCLLDAKQRQEYDERLCAQLPHPPKPPKTEPPKLPDRPPAVTAPPSPSVKQSPWRQSVEPKDSAAPEFEPDWVERAHRHEDPRWFRAVTGGIAGVFGAIWREAIVLPRKADGLLRAIAGGENRILLNFLRVAPVLILVVVVGILILARTGALNRLLARAQNDRPAASNGGWHPNPIPADTPKWFANSTGMEFVLIPPGEFMMGAAEGERGADEDEFPRHSVRITKPFYMGVHEVTQEEYERVMGHNPSHFANVSGADTHRFPVETVSWDEATEFCRKLSALPEEQNVGRTYRLPTEAEWEYACRAGTRAPFGTGKKLTDSAANIEPDDPAERGQRRATMEVGSYKPNDWLLHDMHGNVWEWCADRYDPDYYRNAPRNDPQGPSSGGKRVLRGGGCRSRPSQCRAANRMDIEPDFHRTTHGFRVVCSL